MQESPRTYNLLPDMFLVECNGKWKMGKGRDSAKHGAQPRSVSTQLSLLSAPEIGKHPADWNVSHQSMHHRRHIMSNTKRSMSLGASLPAGVQTPRSGPSVSPIESGLVTAHSELTQAGREKRRRRGDKP